MSNSIKFLVTSLLSYVTGFLTLSGHLDTSSSNSLTIGFQDIIGGILIVAPILYNLEHHQKQTEIDAGTVEEITPTDPSKEVAQ